MAADVPGRTGAQQVIAVGRALLGRGEHQSREEDVAVARAGCRRGRQAELERHLERGRVLEGRVHGEREPGTPGEGEVVDALVYRGDVQAAASLPNGEAWARNVGVVGGRLEACVVGGRLLDDR